MSNRRLINGFLFSPLAAPGLLALVQFSVGLTNGLQSRPLIDVLGQSHGVGFILMFSTPISYGVTLIFGLPCYFAVRRLLQSNAFLWTIAGMLIGAIAALSLAPFIVSVPNATRIAALAIATAASGGCNALAFWWLAIRPPTSPL